MNDTSHPEAPGLYETAWTRSVALGRRPLTLVALGATLAIGAAAGFLAGHASAPTRTASMPTPSESLLPHAIAVSLGHETVAAVPVLRTAPRNVAKKKAVATHVNAPTRATAPTQATAPAPTPAPKTTQTQTSPGYTIVGG